MEYKTWLLCMKYLNLFPSSFRMATAVSSSGSDEDRTRFFRLSLIIIDELTQILRDLLHNEVSPAHIFNRVIKINHLIKTLRKDQIAVISDANTRGYQEFDITLLYTLLRNVCQYFFQLF